MGISIDQGKLEDLQKFSDFFNFLTNPQEHKVLLADAKKVLAEMTATINAHTTVREALAFRAACEAKVAETNEFVRGEMERIAKAEVAAKDAEALRLEHVAKLEQQVAAKTADSDERAEQVRQAEAKAATLEATVIQREQHVAERELYIKAQLAELDDKKTQLAALLR